MSSKIREALSDACYAMFNFLKTQYGGYEEMAKALDKAKAALAEPLKNYEVGTIEEQAERWLNFCDNVERNECPPTTCRKCPVYWAHMPYKKGDEK